MSKRMALISLVVILLFGSLIAAVAISQQENPNEATDNQQSGPVNDITQAPIATQSPSLAPTISVAGSIVSISEQPVGFMNARILRVQETAGQTLLYITTETSIIGENGQRMTINALSPGDQIQARGEPAEGGIVVSEVVVGSSPSPSPSPSLTPVQTPTP
jgi:membrane-associated protease RseP (regulator of RpoE activity)